MESLWRFCNSILPQKNKEKTGKNKYVKYGRKMAYLYGQEMSPPKDSRNTFRISNMFESVLVNLGCNRAVHLCLICMDGFKRILADGKKFIGQHALNGWRLQPKLITSPCINLL